VPATAIAQLPTPPSPPKPPTVNLPSNPVQLPKPPTVPTTPVNTPTVPKPPTNTPTVPKPPTNNTPTVPTTPIGGVTTTPTGGTGTTPAGNIGVGNNGVTIGGGNPTGGGNVSVTIGGGGGVSIGGTSGNSSSGSPVTVKPGGGQVSIGGNGISLAGSSITAGDVNVGAGTVTIGAGGVKAGGSNATIGTGQINVKPTGVSIGGRASTLPAAGGIVLTPDGRLIAVGRGGSNSGGISLGGGVVTIGGKGSGGVGGVSIGPGGVVLGGRGPGGGGGVVIGPGGVSVGGKPGIGGLLPGAGSIRAGGFPIAGGSIGAHPGLGQFGDNPAFTIGGSAGMIAADSANALRPGAVGAYRALPDPLGRGMGGDGSLALEGMNARPGIDFPAGVLGIDPARAAAAYAMEGAPGVLTPAALVAQQLPAGRATGVSQLLDDIGSAISSVIAGLPDWSRPIILVLIALALIAWFRALWVGRRARRFHAHLAAERERNEVLATENLVYQRALVPALPAAVGGLLISGDYRPADLSGAGGDFYDVFALDKQRVAIILGDVSGHDRRAVERANTIRHSLRTHLWDDHEPRIVLKKTGAALARDETLDGDFATAIVAIHDIAAGTLTYACAGHPAPVLVGASEHEPVSACSSPALGWGIPTGRRQTTIVLGEGDTACFYTDGLIEARYAGGFLGREGLDELVHGLGPDGTASDLLQQVIDRAHEADDDLAALILRSGTPVAARGLRVEELEISEHDVRRGSPDRFLAACGAPAGVVEDLHAAMESAVAATGRAILKVTFDPEASGMEATLEQLGQPRAVVADDPRVLVGD
jgi:hypothetical protein